MSINSETYLLLLLALGSLLSCASDPEFAQNGALCVSMADCSQGQSCVEGYCSVSNSTSADLDFYFFPSQDVPFQPQLIPDVVVGSGARLNFGLIPPVTVSGRDDDNDAGILFLDLPGGPSGNLIFARTDAEDSRFTTQVRVEDGQFSASVHPGPYRLTFLPDSDNIPRRSWRTEFDRNTRFERRIPSPASLRRIDGVVTRGLDLPGQDVTVGVSGATVYATAQQGNIISTTAITDDDARFTIYVEPNAGPYSVQVGPSLDAPATPNITFEDLIEASDNGCLATNGDPISCQLTLNLGAWAAEPVRVDSFQLLPADWDWTSTNVRLSGALGDGGQVKRSLSVEPDGRFTVEVFPSTYQLEIVPPPESRYAKTTFTRALGADLATSQTDLALSPKTRLRGVTLSDEGAALERARVDFFPRPDPSAVDVDERPISLETDDEGAFTVFLEPVDHDVLVRPSTDSGLPPTWTKLPADQLGSPDRISLTLDRPRVLVGSVLGTTGLDSDQTPPTPIGGVLIRAYRVSEAGERQFVGEAQSAPSGESLGNFRMVISSNPEGP